MLFHLLFSCWALPPVILIPPLYGSNLYVSFNQTHLPWYCPHHDEGLLWLHPKYLVPPRFNCLFSLLESFYQPETHTWSSLPGVNITIQDFGGDSSVRYVDSPGVFGMHFVDSCASMMDFFHSKGYTVRKDLFAAPYDWRTAPVFIDAFHRSFRELVERSYDLNDGQKVTIVGYSCGGFNLQIFLTTQVSLEWKRKYIEKVIFLAPSFGGCHLVWLSMFRRYSPLVPFVNEYVSALVERLPCLQSHLLNREIFGDLAVVRGPGGEGYTAKDLADLLIRHAKIAGDRVPMLNRSAEVSMRAPAGIGLPTMIVYNSAIQTHILYDFNRGWDKKPKISTARGDGTIPAQGVEWACDNWDYTTNPVFCFDLANDGPRFEHQRLTTNPFVHEHLYNATVRNEWATKSGGKTVIRAPRIDIKSDKEFTVRNDPRKMERDEFL
jgi:lecithin-cholesterol acyltransferase